MTKKWYVLHTYSGYENKVKKNLETRIETMGLENNVFAIQIPTETVTEIKEGGRRVESDKKVFPGYVLVRMELDDRSWAEFDGVVSEVSPDSGKVKVMVSIFGRETPVELSFDQVANI